MKRLLYMWKMRRTFKDRENREVATLLYDHLGIRIVEEWDRVGPDKVLPPDGASLFYRMKLRLVQWVEYWRHSHVYYSLILRKDWHHVTLAVYDERGADGPFRNKGWEMLSRDRSFFWNLMRKEFGIPTFSSPNELKMKLQLRGLECTE